MDEQQTKEALKEALKEWLDDKFAAFGKWTFSTIAIAILGAVAYIILVSNGWQRVPH